LLRSCVDAVPGIDERDVEDQSRKCSFVEVPYGVVPDLIWNRIRLVTETSSRLGEGKRCTLGVGKVRRLSPGRNGEQAIVAFAGLF
jgi:hypothetical protein